MKIGSVLENQNLEKRVAITPEIVKKYTSLGFEIYLSANYSSHLGIDDKRYSDLGVKFLQDDKEILINSDLIVQLGMLSDDKISLMQANQTLIGVLNPYDNKEKFKNLIEKNKYFLFRASS